MAVHTIDTNTLSVYYDTLANDTMSANRWMVQYNEVRYMAYDTTPFISDKDFALNAFTFMDNSHKIPIGIIHNQFYRFKSDALTTPDYFDFHLIANELTDKPNRPNEPYTVHGLFSASALANVTYELNTTFVINKSWFVLDNFTSPIYNLPGYNIEIDFDDGGGIQTYPAHIDREVNVNYITAGEKIIHIDVLPIGGGDILYSSKFRIRVRDMNHDNITLNSISKEGMNVSIVEPCDQSADQGRKIAIVVEGFDFFEDNTAADTDTTILKNTQIDELRKFGYEFHIIDWWNSKLDMRTNADYLMQYMDELKCELIDNGNFEPMVVIGHSMGGIVANYALTKWENNPGFSQCYTEYLHFTRLLLTLDSPHQGANVPLAYQHYYNNSQWLLDLGLIEWMGLYNNLKVRDGLLNSTAARQLLMYHVDTKSGSNYSMHPERQSFINDLNAIGGMPSYCKVVATSSGSATGYKQVNAYSGLPRQGGDNFFEITGTTYAKILFFNLPFNYINLDMESSNGSNEVYRSFGTQWLYKITLKFFGFKLKIKDLYPIVSEYANIHPYDIESGGNIGLNFGLDFGNNSDRWEFPKGSFNLIYTFNYNQNLSPGVWKVGGEAGLGPIGLGGAATIKSAGFDFNFVPLRSALNYSGNIYSGTQSPNIENTPASIVTTNTPFDVILAVPFRSKRQTPLPNVFTFYNYGHSSLYNPNLYWHFDYDPILYRTCEDAGYVRYSYLLNREIGDEKLYLENWNQAFPFARYRTEYDVYINERNPAYNYPNFFDIDKNENGAFSKEDPFTFETTAEFVSDQTAAQSFTGRDNSPGFVYNPPIMQNWADVAVPQFICCSPDPDQRKKFIQREENTEEFYLASANQEGFNFYILLNKNSELSIYYELINMQGQKLAKGLWHVNSSHLYMLTNKQKSGIYLLRIRQGKETRTLKIIKS